MTLQQQLIYSDLILRQKIVASFFIILILLLTIEFIRRRTLKERYAILWLVAGVVLIPLVLWSDFLTWVSGMLGIAYPPFTILLTGTVFLIVIIFHFSVALSKSRRHEAKLLMRIVELEQRLAQLEGEPPQPAGQSPTDKQPAGPVPR